MNVRAILDLNGITYIDAGSNVRKGCVAIQCPLCGSLDPSQHMNISLKTGFASCWRDARHKMNFRRLITMLAGPAAAASIGANEEPSSLDSYERAIATILRPQGYTRQESPLIAWPEESRTIKPTGITTPYWNYMQYDRKLHEDDISWACKTYDLRCCVYGKHAYRILFPIHDGSKRMIAFYGRAIGNSRIRYKAEPPGPAAKWGLFGLPQAQRGGRRLIIVEGPFDALNMNIYAPRDCYSISVQTTSVSPQQRILITQLIERFDEVMVLFDQDADVQSYSLVDQLVGSTRVAHVPDHRKDPGEMNAREAAIMWNC